MAVSTKNDIVEVTPLAEKIKLALALVLAVAAVAAFYWAAPQGPLMQWGGLLLGLVLAAGLFFTSDAGKTFWGFVGDATAEVRKVVWPTRKEATQMTVFVFGFVVVMALFLWLTDKTLEWVLYDLILGWRK